MNMPTISPEKQLADGLRIDGRAQKVGSRMVAQDVEAARSGAPRSKGVAENFKSALSARLERFQKSGQTGSRSAEDAQALADSLALAAAEVKDVYGQEAANKFMADVLQGVDKKGLSFETLTASVSGALKDAAQAGTKAQFAEITEAFNRDLGKPGEEDGQGRAVRGLSQSLNQFFQTEAEETDKGLATQGFDAFGNWNEMTVAEEEIEGNGYIGGSPDAAQQALEAATSFTFETLGEETKTDLENFLRDELGAAEAADFLASAPQNADFMSTMDRTIALALRDTDGEGAAKLEQYLNDQVKTAVNAASDIRKTPFGEVEFGGWAIQKGAAVKDGQEPAFESAWRYTNRDDVTYTRSGQAAAKPKEDEAEEEPESSGSALGDLVKKIADRNPGQTGELVDTQA
ncbi:MAG: hypothetical protein LBV79_00570 [Candidatus Adiutrix sp.]|jgi:hypothetical protein|nr:hypothetical protein [Candidatus Adiutrix sp.]